MVSQVGGMEAMVASRVGLGELEEEKGFMADTRDDAIDWRGLLPLPFVSRLAHSWVGWVGVELLSLEMRVETLDDARGGDKTNAPTVRDGGNNNTNAVTAVLLFLPMNHRLPLFELEVKVVMRCSKRRIYGCYCYTVMVMSCDLTIPKQTDDNCQ